MNPLRVVPLGGHGEIGKNMLALEYGDDIVVIDAGILFPDESTPGVDFAIPDITYLLENRSRVRAILITHGHEDHIGALPWVLEDLDVPVYAPRLAHGLISVKLKERGRLAGARLNVVEPYQPFRVGDLGVEFFRVCHSIPDAMGIAVTTPLGVVVHTGDFKIDHTPADGNTMDFAALARFAAEGVLLLCSDSTYAEVEGYTPSEQVVGEALDRVIGEAGGRVMIATFASLISRVQQIVDAAARHGRKVAVIGRSMINNVRMARKMGYLEVPEGILVSAKQAGRLPLDEVVIVATGAQGEPTSALVRVAMGTHPDMEIVPGDTVVISASPIPGNETLVARTIDNLHRQGADVLYSRIALVHVHGHGSREELKMMLGLVKPRFFVPVHGEYRHLVAHAAIARAAGVPASNTFVLEDGDVLELTEASGEVVGTVPAGIVYIEGQRRWTENSVLDERLKLARDGVVVVIASTRHDEYGDLEKPEVMSAGFAGVDGDSARILERVSEEVQIHLDHDFEQVLDYDRTRKVLSERVANIFYEETRARPTVLVHLRDE